MSKPMTIADALLSAKKLIEDHSKWGKGRRHNDRPFNTCCAAEAIEEAVPYNMACEGLRSRCYSALRVAAGLQTSDRVIDWNDAPERTHAEVLAAFDRAIAAASAPKDSAHGTLKATEGSD